MVKKLHSTSSTCHCRDTETEKLSVNILYVVSAHFERQSTTCSKCPSKPNQTRSSKRSPKPNQTRSSKPAPKLRQKVSPTYPQKLTIRKVTILVLLLVISIPLLDPSIQFVHWALPLLHAQYTNEQLPILYEYTLTTILEIIRIALLSYFSK